MDQECDLDRARLVLENVIENTFQVISLSFGDEVASELWDEFFPETSSEPDQAYKDYLFMRRNLEILAEVNGYEK